MALVLPGLFADPEVGAGDLAFAQGASGFLGGLQQGLELGERLAASFERGRSRTEQERARRLAEAQRAQAVAGAAVPESDLAQALRAALLGGGLSRAGTGRPRGGGGGGGTSILGLPPEVGDVGQVTGRAQAEAEELEEAQREARQLEKALADIEEELLLTQEPDLPGLARAEAVTRRREAIRQETGGELSGTDPLEQAVGLAATQLGERRRLEMALSATQGPLRAAQERAEMAPEGLRNPAVEFGLPPNVLLDPAAVGQAVAIFEATGDPAALREIGGEIPRDLRGLQARIRTFNDTIRARQFRELAPALEAPPEEQAFTAEDLVARTTFALGELAPEDGEELRAAAQAHIDAGGSLAEWDRLIGSRERITRESVRGARQRSLADQRIAAARAQADRVFEQRAALQGASRELQAEQAEVQAHLRLAEAYNAVTFSATGTARSEAEAARDRELEAAAKLIPDLGPGPRSSQLAPAPAAPAGRVRTVRTRAEYDALPSGATYIEASTGKTKRKP